MFGKLGDMMGKLQEAKRIADEIKRKLDDTALSAEAASGDIKVCVNGNRKVLSVHIAPSLQHGDAEFLNRNLIQALNEALNKAEKLSEAEMKKAAGGLMPGLF